MENQYSKRKVIAYKPWPGELIRLFNNDEIVVSNAQKNDIIIQDTFGDYHIMSMDEVCESYVNSDGSEIRKENIIIGYKFEVKLKHDSVFYEDPETIKKNGLRRSFMMEAKKLEIGETVCCVDGIHYSSKEKDIAIYSPFLGVPWCRLISEKELHENFLDEKGMSICLKTLLIGAKFKVIVKPIEI